MFLIHLSVMFTFQIIASIRLDTVNKVVRISFSDGNSPKTKVLKSELYVCFSLAQVSATSENMIEVTYKYTPETVMKQFDDVFLQPLRLLNK